LLFNNIFRCGAQQKIDQIFDLLLISDVKKCKNLMLWFGD